MSHQPVIIVHGGAGAFSAVEDEGFTHENVQKGVLQAAKAGYDVLRRGGTAVDAVQAAVMSMEDNPLFNAGTGSCFTVDRTIEMDAVIMDGGTLHTGATCNVKHVKNPIKLARLVMDKTSHTMIAGEGARTLAEQHGLDIVTTEALTSKRAQQKFENSTEFLLYLDKTDKGTAASSTKDPDDHDTVGAVALDCHGNLAVANSTGGLNRKMVGRVGDTPIVGSGAFADNQSGAFAASGDGEAMVRVCTCKHASMLMEQGMSPQKAVEMALEVTRVKGKGIGGMIAVNCKGETGITFNTTEMSWVKIQGDVMEHGMHQNECLQLSAEVDTIK